MQNNPYRSPDASQPSRDAASAQGRTRTADLALVGLFYGGTIGAASGAAAVVCWLGWSAVANLSEVGAADHLSAVEMLLGAAVARIVLGGCLGCAAGAVIGLPAGALAATVPPRLRRRLAALTAAVSALAAAACVFVAWFLPDRSEGPNGSSPPVDVFAVAVAAGALGGLLLGRTLSARGEAPFSSTESGIQ